MCTRADQAVFVDYDNYIVQMGTCADTCMREFLDSAKSGRQCVIKGICTSLAVYTPACRQCAVEHIACQTTNCKTACTPNRYSDSCVSCTNKQCRAQFARCSGLSGAELEAGGGWGAAQRSAPAAASNFPVAAVAGGVVGAFATAAVALVVLQRFRERGATAEMTSTLEARIFGGRGGGGGPSGPEAEVEPETEPEPEAPRVDVDVDTVVPTAEAPSGSV